MSNQMPMLMPMLMLTTNLLLPTLLSLTRTTTYFPCGRNFSQQRVRRLRSLSFARFPPAAGPSTSKPENTPSSDLSGS
ncbi:hypothetical protein F5B18DRAFT_629127 [Nemania serpens]|nr:hypothetical protein F5B18DRAFT_629127 [Nemania serpens]